MIKFQLIFLLLYMVFLIEKVELAKPKPKSALFAATQVNVGGIKNQGYDVSVQKSESSKKDKPVGTNSNMKRLKTHLLSKFDRNLHPIEPEAGNLLVKVGFTFRQILDLDEKNQILKSLIWFYASWNDPQLSWNPDRFGGIETIDLPSNLLWRPDIVVYEEIGVRDYSPRLQNFEIFSSGNVQFREPTVFETTCSINTAFFPFDVQTCHLTFVSWTDPVTKTDLASAIDTKELQHSARKYFVNTGEWKLIGITVDKMVTDYAELLKSHPTNHSNMFDTFMETETNKSKSNLSSNAESFISSQSGKFSFHKARFQIPPKSRTTFSSLGNTTLKNTMFAEIKFTVVIRRNSSLYMQSMLFPSILLTAVAVLGFYLPPDSGERIGLQITILLTFMVFLLAVGEMFPASTGPYLGIYFVLCMGLLGVNLAMTVLVLNLHFKPVIVPDPDYYQRGMKENLNQITKHKSCCCCLGRSTKKQKIALRLEECKRNKSAIPISLRRFLQFCDRYWSLKEYNAKWLHNHCKDEDEENNDVFASSINDDFSADDDDCISDSSCSNSELLVSNERKEWKEQPPRYRDRLTVPVRTSHSSQSVFKSTPSIPTLVIEDGLNAKISPPREHKRALSSDLTVERRSTSASRKSSKSRSFDFKKHRSSFTREEEQDALLKTSRKEARFLHNRLIHVMRDVRSHVKKKKRKETKRKTINRIKEERKKRQKEKAQEREEMEQEEWKSVARAIDTLCFRLYAILIVVSHCGLFAVAIKNWYTDGNFNANTMN